jgi:hypothetical protein
MEDHGGKSKGFVTKGPIGADPDRFPKREPLRIPKEGAFRNDGGRKRHPRRRWAARQIGAVQGTARAGGTIESGAAFAAAGGFSRQRSLPDQQAEGLAELEIGTVPIGGGLEQGGLRLEPFEAGGEQFGRDGLPSGLAFLQLR